MESDDVRNDVGFGIFGGGLRGDFGVEEIYEQVSMLDSYHNSSAISSCPKASIGLTQELYRMRVVVERRRGRRFKRAQAT